ncbi:MAG: DnaB-like helicase C-terminal domain-containing protein, partial [Arenicella sp.]
RMLSSLSRINSNKLRTGQLSESDWPRLVSTMNMLKDKAIYVDDNAGLSPLEVRTRSRRLSAKIEGGLGLIVIDYLQLMSGSGDADNRTAEISNI